MPTPLASFLDPLPLVAVLRGIMPGEIPAIGAVARAKGIPLQFPVHSHFIYDRGIPLWAGSSVGWLYSRLGGTPIVRGKIDRAGLRSARDLFANSQFP